MTRQMSCQWTRTGGGAPFPSMHWSPFITTSPEERRPDPLPLPVSTIVPSKQKGQSPTLTNRQPACCILALGVILSASLPAKGPEWKVNLHWSACCCVHGPEPQTLLGDISAREGPQKSKALTQESQTTNLYSFWGDTVGSAFLPTPVLCPPGGHRLSTSGLC